MYARNMLHSLCGLVACVLFLLGCSNANAQQPGANKKPSDPATLALVQDWLKSFGDDVYHCKWEYDAERLQEINFENGTDKVHIEGEWSFSAELGSSYTIRYGGVEYTFREVEGSDHKILAFWPEELKNGQKFRMHLAPSFNNVFQGDLGGVRSMFYPCMLRFYLLEDQWGNPSVFGLNSSDSDKTVISIHPLRTDSFQHLTLQTKNGPQAIGEAWGITKADPNMYRIFRGAEYEMNYSNVRVKSAWLPSEVTYKRIQEDGLQEGKSDFETAKWKIVGQYTVDKDTSKFKDIVPPDGTLFYDEFANKSQRLGTWKTVDKFVQ